MKFKYSILFLCLVISISITSCNNEVNVTKEEKNSLENFLVKEIFNKKNKLPEKGLLLYLVLRECSCVEENIEFVKKNLNSNINKKNKIVLVIKPDVNNKYLTDFINIKNRISKDVIVYIDYEDKFSSYGNVYIKDKIFIFKNSSITEKMELASDNYEKILTLF